MNQAVIVSGVRTALGSLGGALSSVPACSLETTAIREAMGRASIDVSDVDEFFIENVLGLKPHENLRNCLRAELGIKDTTGILVTGEPSGGSLMLGALSVAAGRADTVVVGGLENPGRTDTRGYWILDAHGELAEIVARKYNVSETEKKEFVTESRQKAKKALEESAFSQEVIPVKLNSSSGNGGAFSTDEIPMKVGPVACPCEGSFSRIAMGAAAIVIMTKQKAESWGIKPICEITSCATPGQRPSDILMAPLMAIPAALRQANMQGNEIDVYEIDEVFPATTVALVKELDIDPKTVNMRGGSMALGYPFGTSATRMLTTLLYTLTDMDAKTGMLSMSLGGMEALAMVVRRS